MTAARDLRNYAETVLAEEVAAVERAPVGRRDNILNRAAFNIGTLVAAGHIAEERARSQLVSAARLAGLPERQAISTVGSGMRAGMQKPREVADNRSQKKPLSTTSEALDIWRAAAPPAGSPTAVYLSEFRGLSVPLPPSIRHHPGSPNAPRGPWRPAMVAALVNVERKVVAVQFTQLMPDGMGKVASGPQRLTIGPKRGAAVRLAPTTDSVVLTEGVEKGLGLMQITGAPCWATCGCECFLETELPPEIARVVLAPDNDAGGRAVIERAGNRFADMGKTVEVALPPDPYVDWDEMVPEFEERAAILQADGLPREEADALARVQLLGQPA